MKEIVLNLKEFNSIAEIHNYLSKALSFPEFYGYNLDALYDLLSGIATKTLITVKGLDCVDGVYKKDLNRLLAVLYNVMEENSNFNFKIKTHN